MLKEKFQLKNKNKNINLGQSVNNNIAPNVDVAKKVNSIQPDEQTSIDIPAFLRQQAD